MTTTTTCRADTSTEASLRGRAEAGEHDVDGVSDGSVTVRRAVLGR